jgi:hypothetical protein
MIHSAAATYVEPLLKARPELFKAVINLEQAFIAADDEKEIVNASVALLEGKPFYLFTPITLKREVRLIV